MSNTAAHHDAFDQLVLAELEMLKSGEARLQRLFARLEVRPQLRRVFFEELAAVKDRADRLDGILNWPNALQAVPMPAA